jgi:putative protease
MLVDGRERPLGDARYLLSPGDLYALEQIPELVDIGVTGLKIEGRYKDSEYVTLATGAYRKAVDEACAGLALSADAAERAQLEQVYSRGLAPHFLTGTNHQTVVRGRSPRHRGILCGRVVRAAHSGVLVQPEDLGSAPLKPGDGIVFDAANWRSPQEPEEGGRVYEVVASGAAVELRFANGAVDAGRIRAGDLVWRSHDPAVEKSLRGLAAHRQALKAHVMARAGEPLRIQWTAGEHSVETVSPQALESAQNRAITEEYLTAQLGRLGNTGYALAEVSLDVEGSPFAPASLLNQLRREAVVALEALQAAEHRIELGDPAEALQKLTPLGSAQAAMDSPGAPQLHLLVRTAEQLEAAIEARPASITLDYLDLYGLRPSLDRVRAAGIEPRVAGPRVLKPGEERIAAFLLKLDCPILVRSAGLLEILKGSPKPPALTGDFSLNAANAISAQELLARGLDRLAPTHDLNAAQVAEMARRAGASSIEAIVYQHLPVFHTEHCVFCRFLSSGTSYRDCGRPCESHRVELRDSVGRAHPVVADVGCRNTVFGAEAQEASAHLSVWLDAGIRHFRAEFVHESGPAVVRIARAFQDAFAEAIEDRPAPAELRRRLRESAPQGITQGSLFVPASAVLPVLG